MTLGGWTFMIISITLVVALAGWCYYRVLTAPEDIVEPPESLGG
jgi:hypothetical protein